MTAGSPRPPAPAVGSPKDFNISGIEAVKALIATRHVDNPPCETQPANAIDVRKVPRADPGSRRRDQVAGVLEVVLGEVALR